MLLRFFYKDDFSFEKSNDSSFGNIKSLVAEKCGILASTFDLILDGKVLNEAQTIQESELASDSIIKIVENVPESTILFSVITEKYPSVVAGRIYNFLEERIIKNDFHEDMDTIRAALKLISIEPEKHVIEDVLFCALRNRNDAIVDEMLDRDPNLDLRRFMRFGHGLNLDVFSYALWHSCDARIIEKIMNYGDKNHIDEDDYDFALCLAAKTNNLDAAKLFIDKVKYFYTTIGCRKPSYDDYEPGDKDYPYITIMKNKNLEFFKFMLKHDPDIWELRVNSDFRKLIKTGNYCEFEYVLSHLDSDSENDST